MAEGAEQGRRVVEGGEEPLAPGRLVADPAYELAPMLWNRWDELGADPGGSLRERFYRLVDAAYEQRSIALSSNLHPAGFDELMPRTLATATVDRLLPRIHR